MGGIPNEDIEALKQYWEVYPSLKKELFVANKRTNYSDLKIAKEEIKQTIFNHPEFVSFSKEMDTLFTDWKTQNTIFLKQLTLGIKPKKVIHTISEAILTDYTSKALMDKYDVYQHVMNYWNETMQDDTYIIAVDGWKAEPYRILVKNKAGIETDKGWDCDLVPKILVIDRYFLPEKTALQKLEAEKEALAATQTELEEEHNIEEGIFFDFDKINKGTVQKRLKAIDTTKLKAENTEEITVLKTYLKLVEDQAVLTKKIKEATAELDKKVLAKYKILTIDEIKQLVVDDKWMTAIEKSVKSEMERISQRLTRRIKELAELYETPLPKQTKDVTDLESKVTAHLQKMGFLWN